MKVAGTVCSTAKIAIFTFSGSLLSSRFSRFQTSRTDQTMFLNSKMPLAKLPDVSKAVNRNRRPRKLFVFFLLSFFLSSSSFDKRSAVLSETMATKLAQMHAYTSGVVHLPARLAVGASLKT